MTSAPVTSAPVADRNALTPGARRAAGVGLVLALFLTVPGLVAAAAFVAGWKLSPAVLGIAVALVVGWTWRADRAGAPFSLGAAAVVVAVAMVLAAQFFDLSFDGQTYHQGGIRALAGGWNPVWGFRESETFASAAHITGLPKAAWILQALLFQVTGALESAKGTHVIGLAAAFLLAWPALESAGIGRRAAVVAAGLATANPVALTQLLTFHVDGLMASSLTMVLALGLGYWRLRDRRWAVALALLLPFLANLKFPAMVYVVAIAGTILVLVAWRERSRLREAVVLIAVAAVLTLSEGINPYVTNAIAHGHPAYPAAGRDAIAMVVHRDPVFAAQPRIVQLARALMSRSSDQDDQPPRAKFPLSVHRSEVAAFGTVDTRIGGLGPLFGGALIIALGMAATAAARRRPRGAAVAALCFGAFLSALVIPFGFYSRYAPQLWLAATTALLTDELRGRMSRLLALIMALNTAFVGAASLGTQAYAERLHREQLTAIARDAAGQPVTFSFTENAFVNVDLHFDAYRVAYRQVDTLGCERPALLLRTHALMCLGGDRSPAAPPDPEMRAAALLSALRR